MRSILGAAIEDEADITIVDMEAGLEHLSRSGGTLAHADALLVVMEPSRKSIITAARTLALANELGIPLTYGVGNKAKTPEDRAFFETVCAEYAVPLAGVLPHDAAIMEADRAGGRLASEEAAAVRDEVERIISFLDGVTVG